MDVRLDDSSAYRTATCVLTVGESVIAETGALVMMSDGIAAATGTGGGVAKGLWRKALGGENLMMVRYTADWHGAWVQLAPRFPGDVLALDASRHWRLQTGSFLAMSDTVELSTKVTGIKTVVMREGVSMLAASGSGTVLVASYGSLQQVPLRAGVSVTVDTGHLVGWSRDVSTTTGLLGSLVTSGLSGEGLVTRCEGPGTILVQTRAEQALRNWIVPDRRHDNGA